MKNLKVIVTTNQGNLYIDLISENEIYFVRTDDSLFYPGNYMDISF